MNFFNYDSKIKYRICFALIIIFNYISLDSINSAYNEKVTLNNKKNKKSKNILKNNYREKPNLLKFNTYNIYLNNIEDFNKSAHLILIPGKNCHNKKIKTFFFKPEFPDMPYKYIKFQRKNISLEVDDNFETQPTFFATDKKGLEFRDIVLNKFGFKLDKRMAIHNLYFTPYIIEEKYKKEISNYIIDKFQKINRFFNYKEYTSKSLLYINYKNFEHKYPLDYNYMLETYSFPKDKFKIEEKFKYYKLKNISDSWMIKPAEGSLGKKISILTNFSAINISNYVITKYLYNPHLIKGYKYDFRFHGLISGIKPLKLYLYNEGLVRLASELYNISDLSIKNNFVFITNLHINIKNKNKFIYPKNLSNLEDSNLWNLETFQKYCERNNINYTKISNDVEDIFIKTILSVREKIIKGVDNYKLKYSNFYHLIGFDIILDENLKPYLLEMNRKCAFRSDNDAEKYFTSNLIADTLNIVGIKSQILKASRKYSIKKSLSEENLEENLCELDRPRGGYKLIFPLKKNIEKYKKFYGENIPKEDLMFWEKIIE